MKPFSPRTEEGLRVVRDAFRRLAASWYLLPFALATFICTLVWVVRPEPVEMGPRLSAEERYGRGMAAYDSSVRLLGPASRDARADLMKNALLHLRTLEMQYGVRPEMFEAHKAMGDVHLEFARMAAEGAAVPGGRGWNLQEAEREYARFLELVGKNEDIPGATCARAEALVELGRHELAVSILEGLLRDIGRAQVDALLEEKETGVQGESGGTSLRKEVAAKARFLHGKALLGLGREEEARAELERFLASGEGAHEDRSRGSLLLAQLFLRRRASLERARELFGDSPGPEARLGLARIEFALGNCDTALEILSRRPKLPGKWGRAADFLAAVCLLKLGEPVKAAQGFHRLSELHPAEPEGVASVVGLAEAAIAARFFPRAMSELEKACRLTPPQCRDAVELPERDVRLTREHLRRLLLRLAKERERSAKYEEAYRALRLARDQGFPEEDFARAGARVLAKEGAPDDLVRSAKLLLRLRSADSVVLASKRFAEAGDPAGAAHACELFARLFPGDARASRMRHKLGLRLRELGLFVRARQAFRMNSPSMTECARDPYAYESSLELARTYAVQAEFEPGREKELLTTASDAYGRIMRDLRFGTDSLIFAKAVFERAEIEARLGHESSESLLASGIRNYQPGKEGRPLLRGYCSERAPHVCLEVGHMWRRKGDFSRAAVWYGNARKLAPSADAAVFEALALRALGRMERSLDLLRLAEDEARADGDDELADLAAELAKNSKDGGVNLSILRVAAGRGGDAEESGEKAH